LHSKTVIVIISRHFLIIITQLEVTFDSARGVLGTIAIVTVREQHHKAGFHVPLGFTRCDHCVNDDLSFIREITELSFPKDESVRVSLSVTVFVT
jgi:hypothetical protein